MGGAIGLDPPPGWGGWGVAPTIHRVVGILWGGVAVLGIDSTGYSSDEFELSFKMSFMSKCPGDILISLTSPQGEYLKKQHVEMNTEFVSHYQQFEKGPSLDPN